MPIHSYTCQRKGCNHEFDVFYKVQSHVEKEEPQEECPKCGSKKKKRMIAKKTSFVLKGRGWAKDRYE